MQTALQPYQGSWLMPAFDHASVVDAMHPGVMTCLAEESLVGVARTFATHHIHAIVVVAHEPSGGVEEPAWSVLSDRDLVAAALAGIEDRTAGEAANTEAPTIDRDASLEHAARLMTEHDVSHLVVVSDGRPVGMISTIDIAGSIAWGRA